MLYLVCGLILSALMFVVLRPGVIVEGLENQAQRIQQGLDNQLVFHDLRHWLPLYYMLVGIGFCALELWQPAVVWVPVFGVLAVAPPIGFRLQARRRLEALEKQLPDALMMIAGGVRAGASLPMALQQLGEEAQSPLREEISLLLREQKVGVPLDEAFQHFQERIGLLSVTLITTTIRIAHETGGELAEALSKTAMTLRQIEQAEGKVRALTAQGKMQAWVVGAMPLGLMLILNNMEPEAMAQLWTTPVGWLALGVIGLLEIAGIAMILKIVDVDV